MPKNYNIYLKGYVGGWGFNSDMVSYILDKNKAEKVTVLIDSLGGSTAEGLSISALFKNHGDVHCHYVGMSASAATIASMGAKHISIDAHALLLVHKCAFEICEWQRMNADELAALISDIEKLKADAQTIDSCVASLYASRCKKKPEELLALMSKGAWLTAQQALEWGFVDEITDSADDIKPQLTESLASDIMAAGIPMPPVDIKKSSFLDRIMKSIGYVPENITSPASETEAVKTIIDMPSLSKISEIIGAELEAENGSISVSVVQAEALEAELNKNSSEIQSLELSITQKDAQISQLEAKVADLSKEPAAATADVNTAASAMPDPDKMAEALAKIFS